MICFINWLTDTLVFILSLIMEGRMIPKDTHTLIPGTYKYVTLHDKKGFADIIEVKDFKTGKLSCIISMGQI